MYYTIKIKNTFNGLEFVFVNFDDAVNFMGLVVENGRYTNSDGTIEPVSVTMTMVEV